MPYWHDTQSSLIHISKASTFFSIYFSQQAGGWGLHAFAMLVDRVQILLVNAT